ncbi:MAG: Asp/Glu racemase [Geodermatophilaceae bacterium]|nr:Asp/Glu racemase [Geodermatophilaceae bacterium]
MSLPAGPPEQIGVGLIAPFDLALDRELWRWVPDEVTLLLNRTPYVDDPVSIALAEAVSDSGDVSRATRELIAVAPRCIAYACTSGSFVHGVAGQKRLVEAMCAAGAPQAVTTSGALLDALCTLGIHRVAVATPYVESLTVRLGEFLAEAGIDTVAGAQLGLSGEIWKVPYGVTTQLIRDANSSDAQAVFVSCTNLATYDLIAPLEAELGKPVLTANQVTLWAALRRAGSAAIGPGQRLLT